jgi:hypothetical protein
MGPADLALAHYLDDFVQCHAKAEPTEPFDYGGVSILSGVLQDQKRLIHLVVIQTKAVPQDVETAGTAKEGGGRRTEFDPGQEMKAGWNTDLQRFPRAVYRVVIGYGNGVEVLCLSEVEDLSRCEGAIRGRGMNV